MNGTLRVRCGQKWEPYNRKYRLYILPEKVIACAGCGKPVKFGDAYTSLEIHTEAGIGFSVCPRCYIAEIERAKDAEEMQREEER